MNWLSRIFRRRTRTAVRDLRGSQCGIIKVAEGYQYLDPYILHTNGDPAMKEFFAARLRGESVSLPLEQTHVDENKS